MNRKVHFVTHASPKFRHRQILLGLSAKLNGVADTVTNWTPARLLREGFHKRCPDIRISELGSGYWAWKPFIIQKKLNEVPDEDLVFYCDVGRKFPYKLLSGSITAFQEWMDRNRQRLLPGVCIPWQGPMSKWTKRDAFVATGMDRPQVYATAPIQASFSLWIADDSSRNFLNEWMDLASQRPLISGDKSICGLPELPDFHEHRYDQALLSLCCIKHGIKGLDIGSETPSIDTQHPSEVAFLITKNPSNCINTRYRILRSLVRPLELLEATVRKKVSFAESVPKPQEISGRD